MKNSFSCKLVSEMNTVFICPISKATDTFKHDDGSYEHLSGNNVYRLGVVNVHRVQVLLIVMGYNFILLSF